MSAKELIVSNPAIMIGKPVVAGTRIAVELIVEKLAAGETVEQLLVANPRLTREAIQAALAFAAEACIPTSSILLRLLRESSSG